MKFKPLPSIERLRALLELRGAELFWRMPVGIGRHQRKPGDTAGSLNGGGYKAVCIDGDRIYSHRIIFALFHGRHPVGALDHINLNRLDNRPENLREATHGQNMCNASLRRDNTSGAKGVTWDKARQKWSVMLTVNGRHLRLGRHEDLEFAKFVRQCAAEKYHGEFAR